MNKPDRFLWGVSTAGHQTDGNDAMADTTFLEHVTPTVFKEPAGEACRSWERWEDDLDCVAAMGLNAYRFSVEWCRIEPEEGIVDQAALDHYDRLMDGCLERGISPVLTLCHFTCPHWFAKKGSWLAPDAVDRLRGSCAAVCPCWGTSTGRCSTTSSGSRRLTASSASTRSTGAVAPTTASPSRARACTPAWSRCWAAGCRRAASRCRLAHTAVPRDRGIVPVAVRMG